MFRKIKPYIYAGPSVIILFVLVAGGIFECVLQSFGGSVFGGLGSMRMDYYVQIFNSPDFWKSFFLTFKLAIVSTIIASLSGLGIIFLIYMARVGSNRNTVGIQRLFQLPMLFPYLVAGYVIFLIFSQSGFISRIMFGMGVIQEMSDFPALINDKWGIGIVLAYVWKTTPFIVLMLYPVVLRIESGWLDAGYVFGFGNREFFVQAVLPMMIPTLKICAYIIFTFMFCSFEVPYILGSTYPKALPVYAYQVYSAGAFEERPVAMAASVVMIIASCIMGALLFAGERKNKLKSGGYIEKDQI